MESVFITDPTGQSAAWMIRDNQGRDALRVWNIELKHDPDTVYLPHPTRPPISERPAQRYTALLDTSVNLHINPPYEPSRRMVTYPNKLGYL